MSIAAVSRDDATILFECLRSGTRDLELGAGRIQIDVAVLWLGPKFCNFLRIGNLSFWGSGQSQGPGRPFQKVGGEGPHLLPPK